MTTTFSKGTAILSLALGLLACSDQKNERPSGPPQPSDARVSDAARDMAGPDLRATDTARVEVSADTSIAIDAGEEVDAPIESPWRGFNACADIPITDPEEALAKVPNMPCLGCLECNYGLALTVCGRPFGATVKCICSNDVFSCIDQRPKAIAEEASELEIDGGALCPSPSWPHDAGADQ
jgi:hypothetical protein